MFSIADSFFIHTETRLLFLVFGSFLYQNQIYLSLRYKVVFNLNLIAVPCYTNQIEFFNFQFFL